MALDPYQPPRSRVSDPEGAAAQRTRPRQVGIAVALIWFSLVLGIVNSPFDPNFRRSVSAVPEVTIGSAVVTLAFIAMLAIFIGQGRNWARIVFAVLALVGSVGTFITIGDTFRAWPATGIVITVQGVMQLAAVYLMLTRPGAD